MVTCRRTITAARLRFPSWTCSRAVKSRSRNPMAYKHVAVHLFRPDGGTILEFDDVDVTNYSKDMIEFQRRVENGNTVEVRDYTSNLPYVIYEVVTGPKELL